jgi:hypothetical protein
MNERQDLAKILNINSINVPEIEKQELIPVMVEQSDDLELAKDNIKNIIRKGTDSLDEIMDVAKRSEHPRAYEVLSNLIRTLVDANKELAAINIREKGTSVSNDNRKINNNVFLGSTADLLSLMKPHKVEEIIIDHEEDD